MAISIQVMRQRAAARKVKLATLKSSLRHKEKQMAELAVALSKVVFMPGSDKEAVERIRKFSKLYWR